MEPYLTYHPAFRFDPLCFFCTLEAAPLTHKPGERKFKFQNKASAISGAFQKKPAAPQKWLARWQQLLFLVAQCEPREEPLPLMPPVILLSSSFSSSSFFCRRSLTASLTDSCLRTSGAFSDSPQTVLQMTCVSEFGFSIHA